MTCTWASCQAKATTLVDGWAFCHDHHIEHEQLAAGGDLPGQVPRRKVNWRHHPDPDYIPNDRLTRTQLLEAVAREIRRPVPPPRYRPLPEVRAVS